MKSYTITDSNGDKIITVREFDEYSRLSAIKTSLNSDEILEASYKYDAYHRRLEESESIFKSGQKDLTTKTYQYDGLAQLKESHHVRGADDLASKYTLDGNGNVVLLDSGTKHEKTSYNDIDQIISDEVQYDKGGRVIKDKKYSYEYDKLNRKIEATDTSSGEITKYSYYPDGKLAVRFDSDGTENHYYYNLGGYINAISTVNPDKTLDWNTFAFLKGGTRLFAHSNSEPTLHYVTNLASTAALLQGGKIENFYYDDYGRTQSSAQSNEASLVSSANNFMWKQGYTDTDTGNQYLMARFYSPELGRFMSLDPELFSNRYIFGNSDPVNNMDPFGKNPLLLIFGVIAEELLDSATVVTVGIIEETSTVVTLAGRSRTRRRRTWRVGERPW